MRKKRWIVIVALVLIGVLGYVGYGVWQTFSAQRASLESPVEETAVVERGTLRIVVNANGSLAPNTEVSLAFSSGGLVAEVLVEEGQQVEAGQPLARLVTDDLALEVTQAEIALRQAEYQADDQALEVTQAEISLRQAELELETLLEPPDETDVAQAQDSVDQAAASLQLARVDYNTARNSVAANEALNDARSAYEEAQHIYDYWLGEYDAGRVEYWYVHDRKEALDETQLALNRAQQQADQQLQSTSNELARAADTYRQAQSDLESLLAGADPSDIDSAQLQIDQARASLEQARLHLKEATQFEVDQARASLEQARLRLEQATLTAPTAGTVTAIDVQPGEMATAGQPVVVLSHLAVLEVNVNLDETDVVNVTVGQEALVTVDAFPDVVLIGEVAYIAPTAQTESGVVLYPVTIRLMPEGRSTRASSSSGRDLPVRAGMTADVDIVTVSQENALIVPLRAIMSVEGQSFVLRQVAGGQDSAPVSPEHPGMGEGTTGLRQQMAAAGFEPVRVTLGVMTETEVEITSGLAEGDVVSVVVASGQDSAGQRGFTPGGGMFGPH